MLTCGCCELQCPEADVVERLVVQHHAFVGILDKLMDRESGVVRLDDGVGDLGRRDNGEGDHHAVRVLLADLRDQKGAHAGPGASTHGVAYLESWDDHQPKQIHNEHSRIMD